MEKDSTIKAAEDRMGGSANRIQTSLRIILKKKKTETTTKNKKKAVF